MKFKLTKSTRKVVSTIISSILVLSTLIFALLTLNSTFSPEGISTLYFGFTFVFLSASRQSLSIKAMSLDKSKICFFKNQAFSLIYLVLGILLFAIPFSDVMSVIICCTYFFLLAANRVCLCFERKKVSSYIFNGILAFVALSVGITMIFSLGTPDVFVVTVFPTIAVIMIMAIVEILIFAFSRMKLKGIIKIMRKTYAFEVFYGLIVLIIACSLYFMIMEENIPTFGDGLWYSFAVVTTIGFGDFTVTSVISRILSVILGIYGLIVVATITSIVVNFYNEVKEKKDEDNPRKDKKEDE